MVTHAWSGEHIGLTDGVSDPGPHGRGQVGRQVVDPTMGLNQQVQCPELLQQLTGPALPGKLAGQ